MDVKKMLEDCNPDSAVTEMTWKDPERLDLVLRVFNKSRQVKLPEDLRVRLLALTEDMVYPPIRVARHAMTSMPGADYIHVRDAIHEVTLTFYMGDIKCFG